MDHRTIHPYHLHHHSGAGLAAGSQPGAGQSGSAAEVRAAAVSSKITYQGQLTDPSGNPLSGSYSFTFELYDAAVGGTKRWQQAVSGVQVQNGLFTIELDVDAADFSGQALWLAITVNAQLLSPRQELLPAPYALSLRPGASIQANLAGAALDVYNAAGNGVAGATADDTEFEAAGVYGYSTQQRTSGVMGRSEWGFGVYGQILNPDSTHSAVVGYNAGQGIAISGLSLNNHGVFGETEDDTEWQAAGVYGKSTHDRTFGVLGESERGIGVEGSISNPENSNAAVIGFNTGGGAGVEGYSTNDYGVYGKTEDQSALPAGGYGLNEGAGYGLRGYGTNWHGVFGSTSSTEDGSAGVKGAGLSETGFASGVIGVSQSAAPGAYGGKFENAAADGAALYAEGGGALAPDLLLGGWAGTIYSGEPSSGIKLYTMDYVTIDLDEDNDEEGHFSIWNGDDQLLFVVDEDGDVDVTGNLGVSGDLFTSGPACVQYDVSSTGQRAVDVPDFCIDAICTVLMWWSGGPMGAYMPGLFGPTYHLQNSLDNSWIGGPAVSIGGVEFSSGMGRNGDGSSQGVLIGGMTIGGGYASLEDDSAAENAPDQWTVDFQRVAGQMEQASFYICPHGVPSLVVP